MKQPKRPQTPKSKTSSRVISTGSKKDIVKQIQKLKKQIQTANDDVKKTQKMLDVDLFLKQQKQKRIEYAKNLNANYEAQKKIREEKLYKKYKKQEKQENNQEDNNRIQFKTQNIVVTNPITINKSLPNLQVVDSWIKEGHHFKVDEIQTEGLREKEEDTFKNLYKNPQQKRKYDGTLENERLIWKNIKQIAQNSLSVVSLPKVIQENSLIPNDYHSQNILSAAILMTPKICEKTFAQNGKILLAQFFAPNSQVTVIVDKNVLVRQFTHKNINLGSRAQNPNTLWPTLIEKCFDKLQISRNLPHISSSINRAIYTIYGLDAEFVPISNKNVIRENFYLVLGHLLQEGKVGFISYNGYNTKVYQNRVYVLQEVKEHVEKRDKEEKKEIRFKIKNPWRGRLIDSQNVNRFTLLQLLQMFNGLVILKDYPKKWSCLRINVGYFSNGGIGMTGNEWTKNPQYLFTITKNTPIRIILRKSGLNDEDNKSEKQGVFGFLLFHNKQSSNKIEVLKMEWLITKTKSTDLNEASYFTEISKGNYILIPYCTQKSQTSYKFYVLDFFIEKQTYIDFGKARFFDYNFVTQKGSRLNTSDDKLIQSLEGTEKFEKPRIENVDIPAHFTPKITQKILEGLNLNLFKNVSLKHFYIPGLISNLLINKQIEVELKNEKKVQLTKNQQLNQELTKQQMAQNLEYLLGYDAQSHEIDQGLMKDYLQQSVGVYDFQNYGLGQEGLTAILQALNEYPQIIDLDLSGNDLNDYSITFLCYYMEKGNRAQLRKLNVSRNKFNKVGRNALQGLKSTFPKLQIIGCS